MKRTIRFLATLIAVLLLAVVFGAGTVLVASHDAVYTVKEWLGWRDYHRYDGLINEIALKNKIDPMLLKAVIWRESSFDADMTGKEGERGLMQVSVGASADWAAAQKIAPPAPDDLFDTRTNIEVGAWYLKRALQNYASKDDPIPFALAEYNAGRQRVNQWLGDNSATMGAKEFRDKITIGSTRKYVDTIEGRYLFYKDRGRM